MRRWYNGSRLKIAKGRESRARARNRIGGGGYVILLIPNRIREIKEEGYAEAFAEGRAKGYAEARAEARAKGREEGHPEGRALSDEFSKALEASIRQGLRIGREEERARQRRELARYDSGEITFDELLALLLDRRNGDNGAD